MNCFECGTPFQAGMSEAGVDWCFECYDKREAFEERAAIMEYDGGLSREEAERSASGLIQD